MSRFASRSLVFAMHAQNELHGVSVHGAFQVQTETLWDWGTIWKARLE
jgi:hypothetical protein